MEYKLIHNNFDALDVSFQGAFTMRILDQLEEAKERAQQEHGEVVVEIGDNNTPIMIAESGSKGGYRYRFNTGHDGEIWFVKRNNRIDQWNIRVSVSSLALNLYGYEGVKERLLNKLNKWGVKGEPREGSNTPLERISRFDYCFDFIIDQEFEPIPSHFVAHHRVKKHVYGEDGLKTYHSLTGDKINTVRLGEMPGRQVVLYNKTKELNSSGKKYWWDIWDIDRQSLKQSFKEIWRVEIRAGKDELNKWNLRVFKDFEDKAGDVVAEILKAMRYTELLKDDANRSRWPMHPIWGISLKTSIKALAPYRSNTKRENVLKGLKEDVFKGYLERLIGNALGMNTLKNNNLNEISEIFKVLEMSINELIKNEPEQLYRKIEKLEDRFRFLK